MIIFFVDLLLYRIMGNLIWYQHQINIPHENFNISYL
jgi:hypothetical protein